MPLQTHAFDPASELMSYCEEESDDSPDLLACLAYMRGYLDHMTVAQILGSSGDNLGCQPQETIVNVTQARLMFLKFTKEKPELLHLSSGLFLNHMFLEAFGSCKELKRD